MAKSKYQQELEDFKAKLPEIVIKHAEGNGLELCDSGLKGFFDELGIEFRKPRQEAFINLSLRYKVPVVVGNYGDDISEEGHKELAELESAIAKFLEGYSEHYMKNTLCTDDMFLD